MRRRRLWLAGGLVCGLLGCSSFKGSADNRLTPPTPPTKAAWPTSPYSTTQSSRKQKDEPSPVLLAKPSSCVSMADFYAQCAADENRNDAERQRFAAEARKTYRRALQQDAKYLPAYMGLGRLAESLDEREEAVAAYNEALAHHPKDAAIWFERGVSLSRLKRFDDALASYKRAAQIEPKNKAYNVSVGCMLAIKGQYDEAQTWMKRVMNEASGRYTIALALRKQGQEEHGRQQLALALRADPGHKPSLELMARWDESGFRGGDDQLQQTQYAPVDPKAAAPNVTPNAVVVSHPITTETPASLPMRPAAVEEIKPAAEKVEVRWNKSGAAAPNNGSELMKPPMPLIPVLSESWEKKPTAPPALTGLPPVKETPAKSHPVAKLGFEEQQ